MRLQRRGKNKYATYRVVVAQQHAPVKGRIIADLGPYNPHTNMLSVNPATAQEWLAKGVQPSATVHNLLVTHKILNAEKVIIWRPPVAEAAAEPAAPAAAPAETTDTTAAPATPDTAA